MALIGFITSWIYCIVKFGIALGLILGWIPALFTAALTAVVWPVTLISLIYFDLCIRVN